MQPAEPIAPNRRILIIDDNRAIHDDFRKILAGENEAGLDLQDDEALLFGAEPAPFTRFEIDSAYQGEQGLEKVRRAAEEGRPYAVAFVDVRMPPGWDGVETIFRLRTADPNLQTVICTAYTDYSWSDIHGRLGHSDSLLILKKPFDNMEVVQLVHALGRKWLLTRQAEARMADLNRMVAERTAELEAAHRRIELEFGERSKAQEVFRTIFEASAIGITLMDTDGRFVAVNRAFEEQVGFDERQLLGKSALEVGSLSADTYQSLGRELALRGSFDANEVVYRQPADGMRTALLWSRTVQVQGSRRLLGLSLDISDRKRMEEDLRRARVAAETAAKAKSEFLASMSHEIRTPLNGIIGFTQLTLSTELTPDQRDYLETAESSANALLRIINDILDFSKIEAGRLELERVAFSLRECVDGAVRTVLPAAAEKRLEFFSTVGPDVPDAVLGDSIRLRQVLLNLLGNAVKFTSAGSVSVEVIATSLERESAEARFTVRDTGIGIAPENRECIFQPFRQADGSMTRRYGGTGLGLAIATRLVEMAGGRIWVESQEGAGSAFHFTMPFPLAEQPQAPNPGFGHPQRQASAPLSILLAEDDEVSQAFLSAMLTRQGHSVTVAGSGLEALSLFERGAFDLALMDVQMPGMDGLQATSEIRKIERVTGGHLPIVALTAFAMKGDRQRCLEAGMDEYLSKPFQSNDLIACIDKLKTTEFGTANQRPSHDDHSHRNASPLGS
jgi:PAS domain S-box-containing protein